MLVLRIPMPFMATQRQALLFSAYLGNLGVLGDRLFLGTFGASSQCAEGTEKKPIAEDAEVAEVRREKKKAWTSSTGTRIPTNFPSTVRQWQNQKNRSAPSD
jgi:hypothetical protein